VVRVPEYWIQTGSFRSSTRAHELADALKQEGLAPQVTTREEEGQTYHRVRIGPYASKAEAQKFLDWIRRVKGLEGSYVSLVYARRIDP
jgi:DedD protein